MLDPIEDRLKVLVLRQVEHGLKLYSLMNGTNRLFVWYPSACGSSFLDLGYVLIPLELFFDWLILLETLIEMNVVGLDLDP